jgi:hypothetical protein
MTPSVGPYASQQCSQEQALIDYHQCKTGSSAEVLYPPNGEGVRRLIFSVPMRIPPEVTIIPHDPNLEVVLIDRDVRLGRAEVRFKLVNRKTKAVVRSSEPILSFELNAEL